MTTYISFGAGLQMLAVAYLVSAFLLVAGSYICFSVIETLEEGGQL
ncbi:hypothetical protein [Argonema galeatum]|nr:hypothetical protein [Argonema galeatum]MCL1464429.1 hypothetical protein [Argonema galeatum A003/A1]